MPCRESCGGHLRIPGARAPLRDLFRNLPCAALEMRSGIHPERSTFLRPFVLVVPTAKENEPTPPRGLDLEGDRPRFGTDHARLVRRPRNVPVITMKASLKLRTAITREESLAVGDHAFVLCLSILELPQIIDSSDIMVGQVGLEPTPGIDNIKLLIL
jgi:hypothetical protein